MGDIQKRSPIFNPPILSYTEFGAELEQVYFQTFSLSTHWTCVLFLKTTTSNSFIDANRAVGKYANLSCH